MSSILVLSYDLRGTTVGSEARLRQKLYRDGFDERDDITLISWSTRDALYNYGTGLRVVCLKARFPVLKPLYDFLFVSRALRIAREFSIRPTRIVVADFALLWAGRVVKARVGGALEMHLNNLPTELAQTRGPLQRMYMALQEWFAIRLPDSFIVINETTKQYLLQRGIEASQIVVRVPDTIRQDHAVIEQSSRGEARAQCGISSDAPIILSVGRLEGEKGFDELIDVFVRSGAEGYLVIAGEGKLREVLQEQIRSLGAERRILLVGRKERAELWNYYADADAFVLLSRSEALGLVFWEAMYMNVPVIGRPTGGIVETIGADGERGFFWDTPDGPAAFAEKVKRAARKDGDVVAMITRAKEWVDAKVGAPMLD